MPSYEYECTKCHFRFVRKQRFDEEAVKVCPQCEGEVQRVFSVPVFFKSEKLFSPHLRDDSRKEAAAREIERRTGYKVPRR